MIRPFIKPFVRPAVQSIMGDSTPPNVFDPMDLSPEIWLTPGDSAEVTLDANGYVSQATDQSGNNNHGTTGTESIRAAYGYRVGGEKALAFQGTLNGLDVDKGSQMVTPWTPTSDFWVALFVQRGPQRNSGSGSSVRTFFTSGPASGNEISVGTRDSNDAVDNTIYYFNQTSGGVVQTANDSFQTGDRAVVFLQYSRTNYARVYRDNVLVLDHSTDVNTVPGPLWIGSSDHLDERSFNGLIPEFIGGNGILADEDRIALCNYLAKYNTGASETLITQITNTATHVKDATQGVAISSDGFVFTATTPHSTSKFIVTTYNADMSTSLQTYDTSADLPVDADQSNSLYFDEGTDKLYVGANNYNVTSPRKGWILEYDVNTSTGALTFVARYDVGSNWCEGCTKGPNGNFFVFYHDDWAIHEYSTSWTLVTRHVLDVSDPRRTAPGNTIELIQGGRFIGNILYFTLHNANDREPEIYAFRWNGSGFDGVQQGLYPGPDAGQGFDIDGTTMLQSARLANNVDAPRILESTIQTRTALVG
ncbi:MAG: hypothetical protein ACPG4X_19265 [Pikeienuella sp.]